MMEILVPRLVCLAILCLAACSQPEASTDAPVPEVRETLSSAAQAGPAERYEATGYLLSLDSEGLRFVDAATGATRPLPFGLEIGAALDAVARVQDESAVPQENTECGAGPLTLHQFGNGLTLTEQDGAFVGWFLDGRAADGTLATMGGITAGSTRAEQEGIYSANIEPTSLGVEFDAGGLYGLLSSEVAGGEITALWAGVNCIMR